jgi:hypothetical protein
MVLKGLQVNQMEVLVAEDFSGSNKSEYEAMVKEWVNSKKATDFIGRWKRLNGLREDIRLHIAEILERRDYIRHTCSLCPGAFKV